jgi:hypothetical protein
MKTEIHYADWPMRTLSILDLFVAQITALDVSLDTKDFGANKYVYEMNYSINKTP